MERSLNSLSVAAMLASVHYGIGFILGTGEKAYAFGAAGSLYAVSCGLGLIALACLAPFYWQKREPLWTLLGDQYGKRVRGPVMFLSWAWMTGVVASQLLGGAFIISSLRFSPTPVMFLLAVAVMLISLLPVDRAALLFQVLIVSSSLALIYALTQVGSLERYLQSVLDFAPALSGVGVGEVIGISLATVLITVLGMDFHQFVVRAQDRKVAQRGCLLAGAVLLLLAFLPSSVVVGASEQGIIPAGIDGKQTIPAVLLWIGEQTNQVVGLVLVLSLLIAALGSGAGVLRIMNRTLLDALVLTESPRRNRAIAVGNTALILLVALSGQVLINLIVSFYTIYAAGVLLPLVLYVWEDRGKGKSPPISVYFALILGGGIAIILLILSRFVDRPMLFGSNELTILVLGVLSSVFGLFLGRLLGADKENKPQDDNPETCTRIESML